MLSVYDADIYEHCKWQKALDEVGDLSYHRLFLDVHANKAGGRKDIQWSIEVSVK